MASAPRREPRRLSLEEDCSLTQSVLWLAVARAGARRPGSQDAGAPLLTNSGSAAHARFKRQAAGVRAVGEAQRRRGADVDHHNGGATLEARVSRLRGQRRQGRPVFVIGERRSPALPDRLARRR